jgi:hypothetical protein
MASATLTRHDLSILEKIKDPESAPSSPLLIDDSLPRDPHITDPLKYSIITQREREIISLIQSLELQVAGLKPTSSSSSPLTHYLFAVKDLDTLITSCPNYASARNNRAQALRRIYGDGILVSNSTLQKNEDVPVLDPNPSDAVLITASTTILRDLSTAITLLTPTTPFTSLSPQAAKTLSQAYTQRGAFYHLTSKKLCLKGSELRIDPERKEARWSVVEFEENASKDFMRGGRYGNEIARNLAVGTNPVAKLCGEMVREAMRKEYAGGST